MPGDDSVKAPKQTLGIASVAGKTKIVKTVAKTVLAAAGPLGDLAGVAFVILDFVNGDWKGDALGLAGLAITGACDFAGYGDLYSNLMKYRHTVLICSCVQACRMGGWRYCSCSFRHIAKSF